MRRVIALTTILLGMTLTPGLVRPSQASECGSIPLQEVATAYGIDAAGLARIRQGERVAGRLEAVSNNELALSIGFLSKRPVDWHLARLDAVETSDPTIFELGLIEGEGPEAFAALVLPDAEAERLAEAKAGSDWNLSSDELARLSEAAETAPEARRSALQAAGRTILADRLAAYRRAGLDGLAPFDRGRGRESDPALQLRRAKEELRVTRRIGPGVFAALSEFPKPPPADVRSRFFWIRHRAQDRAVVALSHQVYGAEGGCIVGVDRRFYVTQVLNSLQAAFVALPTEDGLVIFYANRTGTDLVTGFGAGLARRIGTQVMQKELDLLVATFQTETEGAAP
jgi:hypothetical protein